MCNIKITTIDKLVVVILVLFCCFGQPGGIYLVFPLFNVVFMSVIVTITFYFFISNNFRLGAYIQNMNISWYIIIFYILSVISILYSINPVFAVRMLLSESIKVLIFFLLIYSALRTEMNTVVASTVKWAAVIFSAIGIILFLNITLAGMQPIREIGSVDIGGGLEYEQMLRYYGIFGYVRAQTNFLDIIFPRIQSFFIEPGYFGFFLELSLFSTLYCKYITKYLGIASKFFSSLIVVQVIALLLSLSLGAIISCCLGWVVYLFCAGKMRELRATRLTLVLSFIFALIIIVPLTNIDITKLPIVNILVMERFKTDYGSNSAETRVNAFSAGLDLIRKKPFLGWGAGQVRIALRGMGVNNSLLTVFVELGIVGIVVYLLIIFAIYRTIKISLKLSHILSLDMVKATSALAGMMSALLFHSLLIDVSWTFIYWLGITLVFLNHKFLVDGLFLINKRKDALASLYETT